MIKNVLLAMIESEPIQRLPYGLLYVASALRGYDYRAHIIHCRQDEEEMFKEVLMKYRQDLLFVGFSCFTGPPLLPTLRFSSLVKKEGIPVVWGGTHASLMPEVCLKESAVDFVIIGEGEEAVCELALALENKKHNFPEIAGLGFKDNGRPIINRPRELIEDIDKYFPAYDLLDLKEYFLDRPLVNKRVLPICSSRGCPYRCGFCYANLVHRGKWRAHSIPFVLKEVEYLKKNYSIDGAYWQDDNFFVDKKRSKEIVEKTDLPCYAEIRADYITPDFAKWLKKAKFKSISIGAESGSNRILDLIKKGAKKEDIINAVRRLKDSDILIDLSFIIGFPSETEKEKKETLKFIGELKKINPNIKFALKIYTPYPGTPLWPIALQAGLKPPKNNSEWSALERDKCVLPWENCLRLERLCKDIKFFFGVYHNRDRLIWRLFGWLISIRWKYGIFTYPVEIWIVKQYEKIRSFLYSFILEKQ